MIRVDTRSLTIITADSSPTPREGRWLFGSLTCPLDELAVDQMLPHQLRASASRPFDHRILFISSAAEKATAKQRDSHAEMLGRVRAAHLVDEMVNLAEVKPLELA